MTISNFFEELKNKILTFLRKIDYQLVPVHEFVEESSIQRLFSKYLPGLLYGRKIGNLIPIVWYIITLIFCPLSIFLFFILRNFFSFKILKIDLSQIGSVLWLSTIAANQKINSKKSKIIVCLPYLFNYQNQHIFRFLSKDVFKDFFFEKNIFLRFIYTSMSWFAPITIDTKKYEFFKNNAYSEFSNLISKSIEFNIENKLEDIQLERARLKFINFIGKKGLVTLNLRNSIFYKEGRKSVRNVSGINYFLLCEYLNFEGYSLAFTNSPGDELLSKLRNNNIPFKVFDGMNKIGKFENLLSLLACKYFIGTSTGASVIPLMNNIPVLWTNSHIPFWTPLKRNDAVIWKKYFYPNNKRISFEEFINLKLDIPSKFGQNIKKYDIKIKQNSDLEILNALKIFLELQNPKAKRGDHLNKRLISLKDYKVLKKFRWSSSSESLFINNF